MLMEIVINRLGMNIGGANEKIIIKHMITKGREQSSLKIL